MVCLKDLKGRIWDYESAYNANKDLIIIPEPRISAGDFGNVGLDLHLGSWFCTYRELTTETLAIESNTLEGQIARQHYVPLGKPIVVHPGQFVLGVTIEWLKFPKSLSAHVVGKSSWGRRGLIIATATGVQPSFNGCLTLEIANVGRAPIKLAAGVPICQLLFEEVSPANVKGKLRASSYACGRKPTVGKPKTDWLLDKLAKH